MLMQHRKELWDAIQIDTGSIGLKVLVQAQRNQWGELLQRLEKEK
jgi:hypothetical protein